MMMAIIVATEITFQTRSYTIGNKIVMGFEVSASIVIINSKETMIVGDDEIVIYLMVLFCRRRPFAVGYFGDVDLTIPTVERAVIERFAHRVE